MHIRSYQSADESGVIALWQRSGLVRPWNDPKKDICRKLTAQSDWFLVGLVEDRLVASVMAGYDGHRGWINYLAVDPTHRRSGYGRQIMEHAQQLLLKAGCPKINLQIRKENTDATAFYESLGFRQDAVISYGKRLIADDQCLYKILHEQDWEQALAEGVFRGCGIDLTDGFIHLSTQDQTVETARRYFSGQDKLLLLTLSAAQLADAVRWETSRDDALFPHVYGDVPLSAVLAVDPLALRDDGEHQFPASFRSSGLPNPSEK